MTTKTVSNEKELNTAKQINKLIKNHRVGNLAKSREDMNSFDEYMCLAYSVRDFLAKKLIETEKKVKKRNPKKVYYLSLEFLMGRSLGNSLINLDLHSAAEEALNQQGYTLEELEELEVDAGLGNGGLGRLAACFLDSMATLDLPATGCGIRYNYGIFKQKIQDGYQVEEPDNWLSYGNPWEFRRPERARSIKYYGHTGEFVDDTGNLCYKWYDTEDVLAMPYDMPIPGYKTETTNTLRLWSARSIFDFNLQSFNRGDYINANINKSLTENITKVLYPNDNNYEGKELRLKQQYFFVSASLQDILDDFKKNNDNILDFSQKIAIQLNDTHPAIAVPELMRILLDEEKMTWDNAWKIVTETFAYTNHTLLPEALETWPMPMMQKLLPRIVDIILEINYHFMRKVMNTYPGDMERMKRMSVIDENGEKNIRMAFLAIIGSHSVNGVAALHTELLQKGLFKDFSELFPEKFNNKTNGITPRRWLLKANPGLSELITGKIGNEWSKNLDELKKIEKFKKNKTFIKKWQEVKQKNKKRLADYIYKTMGIEINENSIFDVQVKRIHEYKRQLLMALYMITCYNKIKENPKASFVPRTFIFSGKAAPGYVMAKLIVKFINAIASVVNNDSDVGDKMKVVFVPNYGVSVAEKIIPAADLSEQLSTAGKEASGTGNMKFALNGALTIGTLDGANIEIKNEVGDKNIFIFGLKAHEVTQLRESGYDPNSYVESSPELQKTIWLIRTGFFSPENRDLFKPIVDNLLIYGDTYMHCADFNSYVDAQEQVEKLYVTPDKWTEKTIINVANMGVFSSDRTIRQYADEIWNIT
ncbi:MAG: glycogen/starch/alpha-glucan phosphorylase [Verrucomicrobiota bacterium]|nr:glycogen/starch/alpha-glucan phosphorylase [Verrucomicrobiota bacterium]